MRFYGPLSLSPKYDLTKDIFTAWYNTILSKVQERISALMAKFKFQQTKHILQDKEVIDNLNDLHEKFPTVLPSFVKTSYPKQYFLSTAQNTNISPNILICKFCENIQLVVKLHW